MTSCTVKEDQGGRSIEILDHRFRVAGIVEPGRGARKFLEIGAMQDLIGAEERLRFSI